MTVPRRRVRALLGTALLAFAALIAASSPGAAAPSAARPGFVPPVRHVFVINIENKGYATTWGPTSAAPYLARTLRGKGVLLDAYYGTAHNSQPNYVAQLSGQGPNPQMQADCQVYSAFHRVGSAAPGQAVGTGCVFPRGVPNLPTQLSTHHLSWKGYMQGMTRPCEHPALGSRDTTQQATVQSQYAVRHDPFMYFRDITDSSSCAGHVVPLRRLATDLASSRTTPAFSYITPDLCSDGHDAPCVDGRPGGLASVDSFLKAWVPRILGSTAFRSGGLLVITADEADSPQSDSSACCTEGPGPNSPLPGILGKGGGLVGALVISSWTQGGTWSTTPYNHYSLLASIEDIFGLPHLGYAAAAGLNRFGLDIYNNGWR